MPRLRNASGVVVSVSDDTARLLGAGWEPVDKPAPATPPKAPAKPPAKPVTKYGR